MGSGVTLTRKDGIPDYAERFARAGFVALAFDYRHWGGSEGEPRRWVSLRRQLEDWRGAVNYARGLEGVDAERIVVWGMSLGGGLALMTAGGDSRIVATIALVPMAYGLPFLLQAAPTSVALRMTWKTLRGALTRRPVLVPAAGPPASFALLAAPEALPGFERLASATGWRNEVDIAGLLVAGTRFRPVRIAGRIRGPVLLQLGEQDGIFPAGPIGRVAARAQHAEFARYAMDHFGCFWPEQLDSIFNDQLLFLRRHLRVPSARTV
jgi:dienelactone hydrolase